MAELTTERLLLRGITAEHVAAVTTGRRLHGWAPWSWAGSASSAHPEDGRVEIGYGLVESRRGRGHATVAATAMVHLALGLPGVTEVVAGVDLAKSTSVGVLEKAGLAALPFPATEERRSTSPPRPRDRLSD
jgi:RimJ/RimL family protein N-acetyltransferase